jgi:hypothetical protein
MQCRNLTKQTEQRLGRNNLSYRSDHSPTAEVPSGFLWTCKAYKNLKDLTDLRGPTHPRGLTNLRDLTGGKA